MSGQGLIYNTPYTQSIARQVKELQERKDQFYPEEPLHFPAGYQMRGLGNPNDQVAMSGGGFVRDENYLLPGTTTAYPPYNMQEAMNTASAGSRCSCGGRRIGGDALGELKDFGIDLAKEMIRAKLMGGGKSALDELKDFGIDLGKDLLKETIRSKMRGGKKTGKGKLQDMMIKGLTASQNSGLSPTQQVQAMEGIYNMVNPSGIKTTGAFSGLGRRKSKKDLIGGFSKKDLANVAKSGLSSLKSIGKEVGKEVMPVVKEVAVELLKEKIKGRGRGRPKKVAGIGQLKGGNTTDDILNGLHTGVHLMGEPFHMIGLPNPADVGYEIGTKFIAPAILGKKGRGRPKKVAGYSLKDFSKDASKLGHDVSKELGLQELGKEVLKKEAKKQLTGKGSDKRSLRGAIVKKVMKEHGLSLPQASKYVKEHGLA